MNLKFPSLLYTATLSSTSAVPSYPSLHCGEYFPGFLSPREILLQPQGLLQFGSGEVFIAIFVVGHPQVVADHRVACHGCHALLEQTDSLRIYFLFVIDPAKRVGDLRTKRVGDLRTK